MSFGIVEEDIEWAKAEAYRLSNVDQGTALRQDSKKGMYVPAVEFLRLKAGKNSEFYIKASHAVTKLHSAYVRDVVIWCLAGWVSFAEQGYADTPVSAQYKRAAATDLMEQVQTLLGDGNVTPSAPVMLAGAALEELLASLAEVHDVVPGGKPGIARYATALQKADAITKQDVKDITSWAGMRNDAAHGKFDQIKIENARLMAQGINLFMQVHGANS